VSAERPRLNPHARMRPAPLARTTSIARLPPHTLAAAAMIGALLSLLGCGPSKVANRDPVGDAFPSVQGKALSGEAVDIPKAYSGAPVILMVGYLQETQFDLDRWTFGIMQAKPPVKAVEIPTIPGLVPSMISGWIDSGMRSGIPEEDWPAVVCVYGAPAQKIVDLTGNSGGRNGRILLLDGEGRVRWFHDRGFSAAKLAELDAAARALVGSGGASSADANINGAGVGNGGS